MSVVEQLYKKKRQVKHDSNKQKKIFYRLTILRTISSRILTFLRFLLIHNTRKAITKQRTA